MGANKPAHQLAPGFLEHPRLSPWAVIGPGARVYWKPVWRILDDGEFALVLANAAHVKNVPGRKTDI